MIRVAAALICLPLTSLADSLRLPANAILQIENSSGLDRYDMPIGPWTENGMQILSATGTLRQQAWRIEAGGLTTLQIILPLEDQLNSQSYRRLFSCESENCGGYDFRFSTSVLPAPSMHVDIGDYRYSAFQHPERESEMISLLVSRSSTAGYIQITRLGGDEVPLAGADARPIRAVGPGANGGVAGGLEQIGRAVLEDLRFETGSAQLGPGPFASLQALAEYLLANPDRTIALVGHTDSVGSLEGNIALSKRRAGSVLERLVSRYDIPRRQLEADGIGYLAPIGSNLTEDGREANRRVEAILTSVD